MVKNVRSAQRIVAKRGKATVKGAGIFGDASASASQKVGQASDPAKLGGDTADAGMVAPDAGAVRVRQWASTSFRHGDDASDADAGSVSMQGGVSGGSLIDNHSPGALSEPATQEKRQARRSVGVKGGVGAKRSVAVSGRNVNDSGRCATASKRSGAPKKQIAAKQDGEAKAQAGVKAQPDAQAPVQRAYGAVEVKGSSGVKGGPADAKPAEGMPDDGLRLQRGIAGRVQRRKPLKKSWTIKRKAEFLEHLQASCNVSQAARRVGVTPARAYQLRRRDPTFASQWAEALEQGYAELEMLLLRQAIHGSETVETVDDGKGDGGRRTKKVHSFPHAIGLRLLLAHKGAVEAFRQEKEDKGVDEPGSDAVRREIERRIAAMRDGPARVLSDAGGSDRSKPERNAPAPEGSRGEVAAGRRTVDGGSATFVASDTSLAGAVAAVPGAACSPRAASLPVLAVGSSEDIWCEGAGAPAPVAIPCPQSGAEDMGSDNAGAPE